MAGDDHDGIDFQAGLAPVEHDVFQKPVGQTNLNPPLIFEMEKEGRFAIAQTCLDEYISFPLGPSEHEQPVGIHR
jgi:hypothetical protein